MTLVELPRLLTDRAFRHSLLAAVSDREVTSFWNERYDKWGRDQPKMIESVLNKVTAFTLNPQLRRILGARENSLEFGHIMDSGKVLLVDLGRCDVETRRLLGSLIVTGMEQAARSRKNDTTKRRSFHFYIDEFQDFSANEGTAQTLAQILSECRKYGLHLTLAHQTLTQIGPRLAGALGNIQTKVIFGVSRQDAESLASHVFRVDGERIQTLSPKSRPANSESSGVLLVTRRKRACGAASSITSSTEGVCQSTWAIRPDSAHYSPP